MRRAIFIILFTGLALVLSNGDTNAQGSYCNPGGIVQLVDINTGGTVKSSGLFWATLSNEGRYITFQSEIPLAPNAPPPTSGEPQVYVHDRETCTTELISVNNLGVAGDSMNHTPAISGDGQFVAFTAFSTNLIPNDTNNQTDSFLYDRLTDTISRISVTTGGGQLDGNLPSFVSRVAISTDGTWIAFQSRSSSLTSSGFDEIFVHNRFTLTTTRITYGLNGANPNGQSQLHSLSRDGRYVLYQSMASNLVPNDVNGMDDLFITDRLTGRTQFALLGLNGQQPNSDFIFAGTLSDDGRYIAIDTFANNLVPNDTENTIDVFVYDRLARRAERVSIDSLGIPAERGSFRGSISGDGRFVAFSSDGSNVVSGDTNDDTDVFVHDRHSRQTWRVSLKEDGTQVGDDSMGSSGHPTISQDGSVILFQSTLPLLDVDPEEFGNDLYTIEWQRLPGVTVPPAIPNLIGNGDFSAGLSDWLVYGEPDPDSMVANAQDSVLNFSRASGSIQGVVFQNTETPLDENAPLQAQFLLGNTSDVRKRVTVLLHDADFSDLSACTFWLAPDQPPTLYGMEARTTKAWTAAHLSFYAATPDGIGWYQLDDVKLTSNPNQPVTHTACFDLNAP